MGEHEEAAEGEPDELFFEDRLFLWMTAPMPVEWIFSKPGWAILCFLAGLAISGLAVRLGIFIGQPIWLQAILVGPYVYVTLFGVLPLFIHGCLFLALMPWHAPPPPETPVRARVTRHLRRLKTAVAHRRERRVSRGVWARAGDRLVEIGHDGVPGMGRTGFWTNPIRLRPRSIQWVVRALPDLLRKRAG